MQTATDTQPQHNQQPSALQRTLWVIAATGCCLAVMVACAYLWVFFYATFVNTSGDAAFYEAYAQRASPVVAVMVAFPVFFVMGRLARRFGTKARVVALAVVGCALGLDILSVLTLASDLSYHVIASAFSTAAKLAGALLGSRGTLLHRDRAESKRQDERSSNG